MADLSGRLEALSPEQRRLAELLLRKRGMDPDRLPIPRREDPSRAPLSSTQSRLWTSGLQVEGTPYGNVPMAFRLRGALSPEVLARALSLIVARHEILRTTFEDAEGEVVQRIHDPPSIDLTPEEVPVAELPVLVRREAARPFDPRREVLLRARLFRLGERDWSLTLVGHHLAMDGWGARLLLEELSAVYAALARGEHPVLPDLPAQYGDYAAWEAGRMAAGAFDAEVARWAERLAGAPRQVRLPFDRQDISGIATDFVPFSLSEGTANALRGLSRRHGTTLYVTLLSAFQCLLHRYGGQDDVVVGTILSRRTRSETESLIGNFGSNLLLRAAFDGSPTLAETIDRCGAVVRDALVHSEAPLELVARAAPVPAFHVMFVLRDGALGELLRLPGVTVEGVPAYAGAATLDLILDVTDATKAVTGYFEYRSDRFERATIEQMSDRYVAVLERFVGDEGARVDSLPTWGVESMAERSLQLASDDEELQTELEQLIGGLWTEALEVGRVSRFDNFFDLGGDSMRAAWVLAQIERKTAGRLTPLDFGRQTLAQLARQLEGTGTKSTAPSLLRRVADRVAGALTGKRS